MSTESESISIQEQEYRYSKVWVAHLNIDSFLDKAHMEGRNPTYEEMEAVRMNAREILQELNGYDALEITPDIIVRKDPENPVIKNLATPREVLYLEEILSGERN